MPTESNYHVGVSVSDLAAWVAAVAANGGSVSAGRQTTVGILIDGLKTDNLWTKLDRLWLFAGEDQPSAKTDIVGLTLATAVNTPTFTADEGYTFNGSSNYIDTLFNPTTAGGFFGLNSAHVSYYKRTGMTGASMAHGGYDGAVGVYYSNNGGPGDSFISVNEVSSLLAGVVAVNGQFVCSRTGATARAIYRNGSSLNSDSAATTTLLSGKLAVGALINSGSPSNYTNDQVAVHSIGSGLNATEANNLASRINTYMTALGKNVY